MSKTPRYQPLSTTAFGHRFRPSRSTPVSCILSLVVSVITNFFSWLNKQLRRLPTFQGLRQSLFESIARSCRIRRNPKAIRSLKGLPLSGRPSLNPRTHGPRTHGPRTHGQSAPLSNPDNIVYTVPRAEIVDTLNQTLGQTLGQASIHTNPHPILHPEVGPRPSINGPVNRPVNRPKASPIEQLERNYAENPDTLEELSDSAYLCECQGRYAEAERLYKQVLTLKQRRLGPDHLEIATILNDLAALYCLRHRQEAALPLLKKALTIRQRHLVAHHPDLGETLHQLGKIHRHQAQYGKAEPLFQQALSIFRQQFGGEHPRTQAVYNDLMQMIAIAIEGGQFAELASELPPLDLNTLSDTYSWAKPSWQK